MPNESGVVVEQPQEPQAVADFRWKTLVAARDAAVIAAYRRGDGVQKIAATMGIAVATGYLILRRAGIPLRHRSPPRGLAPSQSDRNTEIALKWKSGLTLEEVAADYGITRERVRQIVRKLGLPPDVGGQSVKNLLSCSIRKERRRRRDEDSEAKCLERWGMSRESLNEISPYQRSHPNHPTRIFTSFRNNVRRTGIRFELTFPQWWRLWQESGRWDERGRGFGYWMARWDSDQPWRLDNIRIVSGSERARDSYIQRPAAERMRKAAITKSQGVAA